MTTVYISIVVLKGSPLDYPQYRHTAFWLQFADRSPSLIAEIVGPQGEYEFEWKENYKPWETEDYATTVNVGALTVAVTPAEAVRLLQRIPIDNHDKEFNCQTWVEFALKRLEYARYLTSDSYDRGVDGMVDAIAEAEDEEE